MVEKFVPVPEPNLKSMPSVLASVRMLSMVSATELIKQAEHCGSFSTPTLNQTGELKAIFCSTSRCVSSSRKICASASVLKYFLSRPQLEIVVTTRPISCRTERSREGSPMPPRKYFCTTTLVASCDQLAGISTSFCSK